LIINLVESAVHLYMVFALLLFCFERVRIITTSVLVYDETTVFMIALLLKAI